MRAALLLGVSGPALALAMSSTAAFANDECGAVGAGGTATCTPAGNNFPDGIRYQVVDLTIVVQDGVIIDTTTKAGEAGGIVSGGPGNYGDLVIKAGTNVGAGVVIITDEPGGDGIFAMSNDGSIAVGSFGTITTHGASATGIQGISATDEVAIFSIGDISTTGNFADGITADGKLDVQALSSGDISTGGQAAAGIAASSGSGEVRIISSGDISTAGDSAYGLFADANGAAAIYSTGDVSTKGDQAHGIYGKSASGTVGILSTGDVSTLGDDAIGIYAIAAGKIGVTSKGDVTTIGKDATGIAAVSSGGAVLISSTGNVSTAEQYADAIHGKSTDAVFIVSIGDLSTAEFQADGISVTAGTSSKIYSIGDISTTGSVAAGIFAYAAGELRVTSVGDITTTGNLDSTGIAAISLAGPVVVYSTGAIATTGVNSFGVSGSSLGGTVTIVADGEVSTKGANAVGVNGGTFGGLATVTVLADVSTQGDNASGVRAGSASTGSSIVDARGAISTLGFKAHGIDTYSKDGDLTITSNGDVHTKGASAVGIRASTGIGIVDIESGSEIVTEGSGAHGIQALTSSGNMTVLQTGGITTYGDNALGVLASSGTSGNVALTSAGPVVTHGNNAAGVSAYSGSGDVTLIISGDVTADGKDSYGALAQAGGGTAAVTVSGDVVGGWSSGAGVSISAGADSTLDVNGGSIGALTDYAIFNGASKLVLTNKGTITGEVFLGGGDDVFNNISVNSFNLRQFADTDGDGIRDTESVAQADFGAGNDTFDNVGTLRLAKVSGATAWDTTGQIAHPGGGNADITQNGVEQGFLTNLETFNNSGLITLADGVAGDLLVITDQADGATKGGNAFTSNGGALALDVVLDDGSSHQSDVLILDKAALGAGATRIVVGNAGGSGGQTTGDGILVVNVRDTSDAGAFALGGTPIAGAYQYDLVFQNQAKTDQNWYLQSSFFEGSLEYPAIVTGALETWYSDVGSLHERLGERRRAATEQSAAIGQLAALPSATDVADATAPRSDDGAGRAGWFRVVGADFDIDQTGPADFDLNTVRAEGGLDVGFNSLLDGQDWLVLGAFAGYGWSSVGFDSGADIDFDIATVGAYATYFRGPYYLDALVKLDWLDGDYNSDAVSQDGHVELPVFGLSLETGYRLDLTSPEAGGGLYLQPQVQLSYAHSGEDSFKDDSGSRIALGDADSLRGRLAARLGQELATTAGAAAEPVRGNFYLEAAVNQEFLGGTEAKASGLTLEQDLPETTFEIGGGIDIALPKEGVSFIVDADYTFGEEAEGISATGGFRLTW